MTFGMKSHEYSLLQEVLIHPLLALGARVWMVGSRARGRHLLSSDVDLVFEMPEGSFLHRHFIPNAKIKLEKLGFPYRLDVLDFNDLQEAYLENILNDRVLLLP